MGNADAFVFLTNMGPHTSLCGFGAPKRFDLSPLTSFLNYSWCI